MKKTDLPFFSHFDQLRQEPKWGLKFTIVILITIIVSLLLAFSLDTNAIPGSEEISEEDLGFMTTLTLIFTPIGSIIGIFFTFFIFWIVAKIMNAEVATKSVFSATLSYILFLSILDLIILLIQIAFGLSTTDYNIASANIFDKGNSLLGAISLQTIFGAFLFGMMLRATYQFSKKSTILWVIVYVSITIIFGLISFFTGI